VAKNPCSARESLISKPLNYPSPSLSQYEKAPLREKLGLLEMRALRASVALSFYVIALTKFFSSLLVSKLKKSFG
jgi:hypothetical protein